MRPEHDLACEAANAMTTIYLQGQRICSVSHSNQDTLDLLDLSYLHLIVHRVTGKLNLIYRASQPADWLLATIEQYLCCLSS